MKNCTRIALYNPIQTNSTISNFANILYRVSYTIAEKSLKILEWAKNNVRRYITLSTPVDKNFTRIAVQYKYTAQSLMYKSLYVYILTNYINAIQYTRSYCYAIIHQSDKIMHM